MDQQITRIPSQNLRIVKPEVEERKPIPVSFRYADDDENISLVSTRWFFNPGNRRFVFLTASGDGLEIRLRSVYRHPPREE